ncbi:MAG: hypothetical protein ACHBNF_18825 [Chromatiales bacterium]
MDNGATDLAELRRLGAQLSAACVWLFLCLFLELWEPWLFWPALGSFVLWALLSPLGLLYLLVAALGLSTGLDGD